VATTWRLIVSGAAAGDWNMAADELLLEEAAHGGRPTLRLYRWSEPTLSLGYFQSPDDLPRNQTWHAVVRRPTGGGAILHDREVTYAVAARESLADSPGLYAAMNRVIMRAVAALGVGEAVAACAVGPADRGTGSPSPKGAGFTAAQRGPFFCFERAGATDIIARSRKLAGGAQRKRSGAILQHGSILLETNQPGAIGLAELAGRTVAFDELAAAFVAAFREEFHATLTPEAFGKEELARIEAIRLRRYANASWLHHGERRRQHNEQGNS
jgi:lipoate-protein ligase A